MPSQEVMVARQKALGNFGEFALRCDDLDAILTEACRLVAAALGADLAKVLEIEDGHEQVIVRAGVGWNPGIVGHTRLRIGDQTSEGYAIREARPVVTRDISQEDRFILPPFLADHGVVALVNVPIFLPGGRPYGLLQVDSRKAMDFGDQDTEFLRTYTTILGPVIDRLHKAHSLQTALETNQRLLQELQHRIKNHIMVMAGVVRMRARDARSDETKAALGAVGERIEALRLVHEQLYAGGAADALPLRPYLTELVENLRRLNEGQAGEVRLVFDIEEVALSADVALPLGLLLNEFVTNALKYAFDGAGGEIHVTVEQAGGRLLRLRVADNGKGLPPDGTAPRGTGAGRALIDGLARQIGATPVWSKPGEPGTSLCLEFDGG